jgi:hypothetical protein
VDTRVRFFEYLPYPQVCTHEVHGWELESGRAGRIGANSSWYGGSSTYPRASSSCVLLSLQPKRARCFNSKGTSFHVVLELEQAKPVDQRSAMQFGAH